MNIQNKKIRKVQTVVNFFSVMLTFFAFLLFAQEASAAIFESTIKNFGAVTSPTYGNIIWTANIPANTSIKMRVRTGTTADGTGASWDAWSDACNVTSGVNVAAGNSCVTDGDQYVQYQTTLATDAGISVPTLSSVTIETQSTYSQTFLKLLSSPFDSLNAFNSAQKITWGAANDGGGAGQGTVKFQIRTSPDNISWGQWCGPTVCDVNPGEGSSDFYTDKTGATNINAAQKDSSGDRWIQYAVFLNSTDGVATPTLSEVTMQYSYNVPPEIINQDDVTATPAYQQKSDGSVSVKYRLKETLDDFGVNVHGTASAAIKAGLFYQPDADVTAPMLTNSQTGLITLGNANSRPIPTAGMMLVDDELIAFDSANGAVGNQRNITVRAAVFASSYPTVAASHSAGAAVYFMATKKTDGSALLQSISSLAATGIAGQKTFADNEFLWDPKNEPGIVLAGQKLDGMKLLVVANDGDSLGFNTVGKSAALSAVLDLQPSNISAVSTATATGQYKAGTTIPLTVTFSENVNFDPTAGGGGKTIVLTLNAGVCTIASAITNSNSATCSYSIGGADNTPEGQYLKVASINTSGVITDGFANQQTDFAIPALQNIDQNNTKQITIDNVAPTVSAGANVIAKTQFTQTATATDSGSGIDTGSYQWTKVSGPGNVTFGSAAALSTTVSISVDGEYVLQFAAKDKAGTEAVSSVNLIWDTIAPTFDNLPFKLSNAQFSGDVVNVVETGSGIESYAWTKKTGVGSVAFGTPNNQSTTIAPDTDGNYVVQVVVTDKAGNATTKTMDVTWDTIAPILSMLTSDKANANPVSAYGVGEVIDIKAVFVEPLASGSTMTVQLENSANPPVEVVLDQIAGNVLGGSFAVQGPRKGYDTQDLNVRSIVVENVLDAAGNSRNDLLIPVGQNLADKKDIAIDTGTPMLLSFSAKKLPENAVSGSFKADIQLKIIATYSKPIASGEIAVKLNTDGGNESADTLNLASISGSTLFGTYTVAAGNSVVDLKVARIVAQSATDFKGNPLTTTGTMGEYDAFFYALDNTIAPVINIANFQVDTTAPTLGATPLSIQNTAGKTSDSTPNITLDAGDNFNLAKAVFSLNGGVSWCAPIDYAQTISSFDITSSSCGGSTANGIKNLTVKFRDAAGNESATASASTDYDNVKPQLQTITTDTAAGIYGPSTNIKITAKYDENISSGTLTINLNNGKQLVLNTVENGDTLTGIYTVGATGSVEDTNKLRVAVVVSQAVADTADPVNTQEGTSLAGITENLDSAKEIMLDTTAPVGSVIVNRSKGSGQVSVSATDSNGALMETQILALDNHEGACDFGAIAWMSYEENISTNLAENSSSARKVCARFRDKIGNISAEAIAITPETPVGLQIDDISNNELSPPFYGAMFTWQDPIIKGTDNIFNQYEVLKCASADNNECVPSLDSPVEIIADINRNYFVDTGLILDTKYCYQVRFKDGHGDYSKLPVAPCFNAGHAPAVSDSHVSIVSGHTDDILITDVTEEAATVIFQTRDSKYDRPVPTKATISVYTSPTLKEADLLLATPEEVNYGVVHTIKLNGLKSGTQYYLKITATDSSSPTNPNRISELAYDPSSIPALTFKTLGVLEKITDISSPPSILTDTRAVINFKTDQNAKCLIQYGTNSTVDSNPVDAYREVPIGEDENAEYTNNHSLTLIGLPSTFYYYQITCFDKGKTHTISSGEYSFKTLEKGLTKGELDAQIHTTKPEISAIALADVGGESARITWTTDELANSSIAYETEGATFTRMEADWLVNSNVDKYTTTHSVLINNLIPATRYFFTVMSADAAGNIALSEQSSFTTKEPSGLSSVKVVSKALGQAVITWSTGVKTSSIVEYGLSTAYGQKKEDSAKLKDHEITLTELKPGETYHFRVRGEDEQKNQLASSDITFQPKAPPKISDFKIDAITEHGSTATFVTSVPTDALITYTDSSSEENSGFQGNPAITAKHEIKLKELSSGTTFSIKLKVRDEEGNETEEVFQSFTTTKDENPPVIDRVKTDAALTQNDKVQAIISWTTDEMATGKVLYKEGRAGDERTFEVNSSPNFSHIGVITSFKPGTVYYFKVNSTDQAGNSTNSTDYAVLTPKKRQNIIQVIIGNFTDIFGWAKF